MTANVVQANYDNLGTIADRFSRQADETAEMRVRVTQAVDALRQGGWEGKGSYAFLDEMDRDIFPIVDRLRAALEESRSVTLEIIKLLQNAEEEAAAPFQQFSILKHIIDKGGDLLGTLDELSKIKLSTLKNLIDNIDNLDDLGKALTSFKGLARIGDELLSTLTLQGSKLGNAGTVLGALGAMMEGYEDWQGGEGLDTIVVSESAEFVLDTAFHIAMYSNPVTGTVMAIYDVAQFAAPIFGFDPESFDVVDDVTDYMGDVIADPGVLVDDIGDVANSVGKFGSGLIDDAGDALSSVSSAIGSLF